MYGYKKEKSGGGGGGSEICNMNDLERFVAFSSLSYTTSCVVVSAAEMVKWKFSAIFYVSLVAVPLVAVMKCGGGGPILGRMNRMGFYYESLHLFLQCKQDTLMPSACLFGPDVKEGLGFLPTYLKIVYTRQRKRLAKFIALKSLEGKRKLTILRVMLTFNMAWRRPVNIAFSCYRSLCLDFGISFCFLVY